VQRYNLGESKAQLSARVDAVQDGSEVEITRHGQPLARPSQIALGFRKIVFTSDLLQATDADMSALFFLRVSGGLVA
jgi:antitoxin (DNA-binding transcriptional repressor) of toxin-antitoxin stability system